MTPPAEPLRTWLGGWPPSRPVLGVAGTRTTCACPAGCGRSAATSWWPSTTNGRYLAGVGLKRHDDLLWEVSLVTDERARRKGLARRLVAQAARAVQAQGRCVLYLHAPDNEASARVARANGFPDSGGQVLGSWTGRS